MDDGGDVVLGEHRGQRGPIGDVAPDNGHVPGQAVPAEQDESTYPGGQVAGERGAEAARGAGDQYGVIGADARDRRGRAGAYQLGRVRDPVADHELRRRRCQAQVHRELVHVDQDEPARALRLRAADEAPRGRGGRVPYVVADRVPGHDDQPVPGRPEQVEHPVAHLAYGGGGIAGRWFDHHDLGGRDRFGHRHRRPVQLVQVFRRRRLERPERQRVDRQHRRTQIVGGGDRSAVRQPYPQHRRAGRGQPDAPPGERHRGLRQVQRQRVLRGVEQRRVQPVPARVARLGQVHLGEGVGTAAPGGPQPLEHRPVRIPGLGEPVVEPVQRDRHRGRRRPPVRDRTRTGTGVGVAEQAGGVQVPLPVIGTGVDPQRTVGVGADLDPDGAVRGDLQRSREGQLLHHRVPGDPADLQGEFDEAGAGEQDPALHRVVGQPRVGGERERAGTGRAAVGEGYQRLQQRALCVLPEPPALERVRGQLDPGRAGEHRVPVQGQVDDRGPQLDQPGRSDGDERRHTAVLQPAHAVAEPDRVAYLPHPVLGCGRVAGGDDGYPRWLERQRPYHLPELVQHRVDVVRVERVADRQPLTLEPGGDPQHRVLVAGDHHRGGTVDRRDLDPLVQQRPYLVLRRPQPDHRAGTGQRLHQPGPGGDQGARVVQAQYPGDVRRGDLADRVAEQEVRPYAPVLQQPEQGHLQREQGRLGVPGLPHAEVGYLQPRPYLVVRRREHRERLVQLPFHPRPLGALPGEQARGPAVGRARSGYAVDEYRAVVEPRPYRRQGVGDINGVEAVAPEQPLLLVAQRLRGTGRQQPRRGPVPAGSGRLGGVPGLLQDHVGVGAADPERRHTRASGPPARRPRYRPGQQP